MKETLERRQKRKSRRLLTWILIYLLLAIGFLGFLYEEGKHINVYSLPKGQIVLTVSKPKYTLGDVVNFTIQNKLSNPIYVNNKCPSEPLNVYRWGNNTWTRIHDTAKLSSCADQPRQVMIAADSSVTSNYANWPNLFNKPGIYRLVVVADNYNGLVYTDFAVVTKPSTQSTQPPTYIKVPVYVPVPGTGGGDD